MREGDLEDLRALLDLDEPTWPALLAFLIGALNPHGPYFCLLVEGEQGSGKSFICSLIKKTLDPNAVEKLRLPKNEHDLMIQASQNHLLIFDNASNLRWDMSDALCALSTGSGFSVRQLYTDNESRTFHFARPFIINGIGDFAHRPDLLERAIPLHLEAMPRHKRKPERQLLAEFDRLLPGVLGCLCNIISCALANLDKVEAPNTIRMADAAQWLVAAETATGLQGGAFLKTLEAGQKSLLVDRVLDDVLVQALMEITEKRPFTDTVGKLFTKVQDYVGDYKGSHLPRTPAHLSTALKRLRPALAKIGLHVRFANKTRKGRMVHLELDDDVGVNL